MSDRKHIQLKPGPGLVKSTMPVGEELTAAALERPRRASIMLSHDGRTAYRVLFDGTREKLPDDEAAMHHAAAKKKGIDGPPSDGTVYRDAVGGQRVAITTVDGVITELFVGKKKRVLAIEDKTDPDPMAWEKVI